MFCQIVQVMLTPVPEYDPAVVEAVEAWLNFLGWYQNLLHRACEFLGSNVIVGKGRVLIGGKCVRKRL